MKKAILIALLVLLTPSLGLGSFVDNGDGTVTDTVTGLMWSQATDGRMAWDDAIRHCEGLTLAGYDDWRLPNRKELRSILCYSCIYVLIDRNYFDYPGTLESYYWSSTTYAGDTNHAWMVTVLTGMASYGGSSEYDKSINASVRAVRAGQSRLSYHLIISSPRQGSVWYTREALEITWDTKGIGGKVSISISYQGGKLDTFRTIIESTENDGVYSWIVSGSESVNCVLKIEPTNEPTKGTMQGLFSIKFGSAIPAVITTATTGVTASSAESGGDVTRDGGASVTARGVCWSTTSNPTTSNSKTTDGEGIGSFTSCITGLTPETEYHVRAYAINSAGTAYGSDRAFTTTAAALPTVSTTAVTSVTSSSAESGGNVTDDGGATVTARGVCWSTSANPTTADDKTTNDTGTGSFTSSITGLSPGTTYHVRAYATNSVGTSYGSDVPFTTSKTAPTVTTTVISAITTSTAASGGNVTSDGGAPVTARGVCWSTSANPTTANDKTTNGTGAGSFTSSITGLNPGTTYHLRSYATNSVGTSYGSDVPFTTSKTAPTVTTTAISAITTSTAASGGNVTSDGGASITARGVCWSTSANPTTAITKTTNGTGTGSFTSSITGLSSGTPYHVRAYATNSQGTSYGSDLIFTTSTIAPTLTTTAVSSVTSTSALSGGNVTADGGASITARGVCWSTSANPTTANDKTTNGTGTGIFTSSITGLSSGTPYHVRAYATNSLGTSYGSDATFTTSTTAPTVITTVISAITTSTATSGGNVTSAGGNSVTARGVCWSTSANPTTANDKTTNGTGTGIFTSSITGLSPGTPYHVRAYATNSLGTSYGSDATFTTSTTAPTVTTTVISAITTSTATSGGNVTSAGGDSVTARGVCWSTSANPTTANDKTTNGTGTGSFTSLITGLSSGTPYHVRAYATNSVGTSYGSDAIFKTSFAFTLYVSSAGDCGDENPCYTSIPNAISDASTGSAILIAGGIYTESITLNDVKSLTLQGGWDSEFKLQTGITILREAPKATKGSLTLQMLNIKPE